MKDDDIATLVALKGEAVREIHWETDSLDDIEKVILTFSDGTILEIKDKEWGLR